MKEKKEQVEKEEKIVIHWNWRKTVTLLLGLLFVPTVIVIFTSSVLQLTVINPSYYKNNVQRIDAYKRMINEGIPSLILSTKISDNSLTDTVAKDVSIILLQKVIDPQWIKYATDTLIDATIKYLTKQNHEITLNLTEANEYFSKASGGLLVVGELIPTCMEIKDKELNSVLCSQTAVNPDEIKKDIDGIRKVIDSVHLEAIKIDEVVGLIHADISLIRSIAKDITVYLTVSVVLLLLITLIIVIMLWKQKTIMVRALTFFTGIGSFLTLIGGLLISQFVPRTIGQNGDIALPPSIQSIIQDFLEVSVTGVFTQLEIASVIVTVISGIFFTLTYLRRK